MKLMKISTSVLAMIVASPALATVYQTEASFNAAHAPTKVVSFSDVATSLTPVGSPYVKDGVTFTGANLTLADTSFWGSVDSLFDNTFNTALTVSFDATSSVGFYVAGSYIDTVADITFYNGASALFTTTTAVGGVNTAFSFFGIDGLGPITGFSIDTTRTPDGFSSVGPISFAGAAGAVPEPATWAMMIGGFGMVGGAMRRRRVSTKVSYA